MGGKKKRRSVRGGSGRREGRGRGERRGKTGTGGFKPMVPKGRSILKKAWSRTGVSSKKGTFKKRGKTESTIKKKKTVRPENRASSRP